MEWRNFGYQNSEIPEPIVTRFGMGDYVVHMTQHAKNSNRSPQRGRPGKQGKYYSRVAFIFLFL